MKLISTTYSSPIITEGSFKNVSIEEVSIQHKRKENYLRIDFEYSNNERRIHWCSI